MLARTHASGRVQPPEAMISSRSAFRIMRPMRRACSLVAWTSVTPSLVRSSAAKVHLPEDHVDGRREWLEVADGHPPGLVIGDFRAVLVSDRYLEVPGLRLHDAVGIGRL